MPATYPAAAEPSFGQPLRFAFTAPDAQSQALSVLLNGMPLRCHEMGATTGGPGRRARLRCARTH
jgi:hypothetical protein